MSGWTHIDRLMDDAIKAIEALQQENEQLRAKLEEKANKTLLEDGRKSNESMSTSGTPCP